MREIADTGHANESTLDPTGDSRRPMPHLFRLVTLRWARVADGTVVAYATIHHESMQAHVSWAARAIDDRHTVGCIVSPRWLSRMVAHRGAIQIARLVPYTHPPSNQGVARQRQIIATCVALS